MAKRAPTATQAQISRAIKGAESAGFKPARVEIEPGGKIVIIAETAAPDPTTALDRWINGRGSRQA
jgi:hypothetical protein